MDAATLLPPGIVFAPDDEVAVGHYLIPRLLGQRLPVDGLILEDDTLSAPPWELLERHGHKEEAFFFAEGQARSGKGARQKRTCAGGGWWEGQKTSAEGDRQRVPGGGGGQGMMEVSWRKKALNFHAGGEGKKGSAGWVMHEYAVTAPEDLARSPLRLCHIRPSSHGRKQQSGAVELPPALGLPPGFVFAPEDSDAVANYLLPRVLGQPLPLDGLILDDDPLSAAPWELLARNGFKEDAFFFAMGQARSSKGSRQRRTCAGGGIWNGEKTCADGEKLRVPGPGAVDTEVVWRKKAFSFQEVGEKNSTGWVMHEYAISAPEHLAESLLRLYRIRFSGHGRKRKRGEQDPCAADEAAPAASRRRVAGDAHALLQEGPTGSQSLPSSSTVVVNHADCDYVNNGEDQLTMPLPSSGQDFTAGSSGLASLDMDTTEILRSLVHGAADFSAAPDTMPSDQHVASVSLDDASVDLGSIDLDEILRFLQVPDLDADGACSSFFSEITVPTVPYHGVGAEQQGSCAAVMTDPPFFTTPNQFSAAC